MDPLARILLLVAFGVFASVLVFLFLIARFYELRARENVFSRVFLLLAMVFLFASARYAFFASAFLGDSIGDTLFLIGCAGTIAVNYHLSNMLMRRRK